MSNAQVLGDRSSYCVPSLGARTPQQPTSSFPQPPRACFAPRTHLRRGFAKVRQGLKKFSDWPTFPQLYAQGQLVGGLDVIKELAEAGELVAELNSNAEGSTDADKGAAALDADAMSAQDDGLGAALETRLRQLVSSAPIMLFMKVRAHRGFWSGANQATRRLRNVFRAGCVQAFTQPVFAGQSERAALRLFPPDGGNPCRGWCRVRLLRYSLGR